MTNMQRYQEDNLKKWYYSQNRKPLILRGARQVGKTHLLKAFASEYCDKVYYINFEEEAKYHSVFTSSLNPKALVQDLSLRLGRRIETDNSILILDEIQACPNALTSLKYFTEKLPQLAVATAGSLLGLELSPASFPVGKVDFIDLFPMSFSEFMQGIDDDLGSETLITFVKEGTLSDVGHDHLWNQFKHYLIVGGMPEAINVYATYRENLFEAFTEVRRYHNALLKSYEADMAKHCGKLNAMHIQRVLRSVPEQLARDLDGSASKYIFKDVIPGRKGYERMSGIIDWLDAAGLVIRTPIALKAELPLSAYTKNNTFKLFLLDVGLLLALSDLAYETILQYKYGTYKGYVAENAVAQLLLSTGCNRLFSWKEKQSELEFLITMENHLVPIEVKSGRQTRSRSLSVFRHKYNPPLSVVASSKPPQLKTQPLSIPLYGIEFVRDLLGHVSGLP